MLRLLSSPIQARQLKAARSTLAHLAELLDARFSVRLWDGSVVPLGRDVHPSLLVSIAGPGVIGSLLRRPTPDNLLGHYTSGGIDFQGGDLIEFCDIARIKRSRSRLKGLRKGLLLWNALPFLLARAASDKVETAFAGDAAGRGRAARNNRQYVQFHYDLGNDFYQLFLDREMQYSCAYFTDPSQSLEQAQQNKLEMICRKLRLQPGEQLLDVGCGWGGLICYAALNYGVRAHGVTLSQTQYDFAREKIRRFGLEDRVKVELRDYATLDGTYDKIASIGMYEHVGIANYPAYFGKLNRLLRDRGILLNHGITRRARPNRKLMQTMTPAYHLINKYIFPGGELDHIGHTCESLENCRFEVHDVENWRQHYAMTTRHWCQRLSARPDEGVALVGLERYRLWLAYLAGVSLGFDDGGIRIYQVVASKHSAKGWAELPLTRADLYAQSRQTVQRDRLLEGAA